MATLQIMAAMPMTGELCEPDIVWQTWLAIFATGFALGGIFDLFALWLFAQWLAHH